MMDLVQYVAQFCKQNSITKDKLAKSADMSRSTLYRMLEADATPTLMNLTKLAIAMQVHPQYLVKLEWEKYRLMGCQAKPVGELKEPSRWFHNHKDSAHFISETVADGSLVCTNERFTKTWRIQNTGNTAWKKRTLQCQDKLNTNLPHSELPAFAKDRSLNLTPLVTSINIPTTKPSETVDLVVDFIAPALPSSVFSYWKMVDKDGAICYPNSVGVYVAVQVVSANAACAING